MNAIVTLANGGFMPVGSAISNLGASLWVRSSGAHHLRWMGDNYFGFSLGDFLIIGGAAAASLLRRKTTGITPKISGRERFYKATRIYCGFALFMTSIDIHSQPFWAGWPLEGALLALYVSVTFFEWDRKTKEHESLEAWEAFSLGRSL